MRLEDIFPVALPTRTHTDKRRCFDDPKDQLIDGGDVDNAVLGSKIYITMTTKQYCRAQVSLKAAWHDASSLWGPRGSLSQPLSEHALVPTPVLAICAPSAVSPALDTCPWDMHGLHISILRFIREIHFRFSGRMDGCKVVRKIKNVNISLLGVL